jgi:hypothetical protein
MEILTMHFALHCLSLFIFTLTIDISNHGGRGYNQYERVVNQSELRCHPIITKYSDINVGSILAGGSAGTAVLNAPSGTRSTTGGTELGDSLTVAYN